MSRAKERVQVEGLGRAVPVLQPTIPQTGTGRIVPTEVTPFEQTSLGKLSQALGVTVEGVREVKAIADVEAQKFQEELARKSPEELQQLLQQNKDEFDKQVRRGAMGWLTSPFNRERNARSIGQASSRLLMEQVYNRLDNPEKGDKDLSTSEVISLVQQKFVGDNESLAGSVFAQEGLQEAVNPQILPLVRQYDAQKSRLAKNETKYGTASVLYDQAESIGSLGAFSEDAAKSIIASWDNLAAYSVDEQRELLQNVITKLASNKLKDEAEDLLDFAKEKLKFGAAEMSDLDYETLNEQIEVLSDRAEKREEADRVEAVKAQAGLAFKALLDVRNPNIKTTTFDGKNITSEQELIQAVQASEVFANDPEGLRNFVKTFESDRVQLRDPLEYLAQASYQQVDDDIREYVEQVASELSTGTISVAFTENPDLFSEFSNTLIVDVYEESQRLANESTENDPFKLKIKLSGFARNRGRELKEELTRKLNQKLIDKQQTAPPLKQEGAATEASTPNLIFPETLDGVQGKIQNDLSVLFNPEDLPNEKALAYKNILSISDETLDETIDEIVGRKPKRAESISFGTVPALGIPPRIVKAEQWSDKEVKAKELLVAGTLNIKGYLLDIPALKAKSIRGLSLDPKRLSTTQHFLITEGEIEEASGLSNKELQARKSDPMIRNIIEVAKLIGVTDYANFVLDQNKLYLAQKKIKGFKPLERK